MKLLAGLFLILGFNLTAYAAKAPSAEIVCESGKKNSPSYQNFHIRFTRGQLENFATVYATGIYVGPEIGLEKTGPQISQHRFGMKADAETSNVNLAKQEFSIIFLEGPFVSDRTNITQEISSLFYKVGSKNLSFLLWTGSDAEEGDKPDTFSVKVTGCKSKGLKKFFSLKN